MFNNRSEGNYRAGLRDGRVLVTTAEGERGEAEFRNGRMNGRCVFTHADAAHFDGQCANDSATASANKVSQAAIATKATTVTRI